MDYLPSLSMIDRAAGNRYLGKMLDFYSFPKNHHTPLFDCWSLFHKSHAAGAAVAYAALRNMAKPHCNLADWNTANPSVRQIQELILGGQNLLSS